MKQDHLLSLQRFMATIKRIEDSRVQDRYNYNNYNYFSEFGRKFVQLTRGAEAS